MGFVSGSGPVRITRIRHGPVITRQVHSGKGKVKLGYQTPGLGSGSTRPMARHRYVCDGAAGGHFYSIAQAKTENPDLSSNGMVELPGKAGQSNSALLVPSGT